MKIQGEYVDEIYMAKWLKDERFTVRRVNSDEWQVARAVRLQSLEDSPEAFTESLAEAYATPESMWQARVQENSEGRLSICFLAFFHNEPIGIAVGIRNPEDAPEARLASMWVMPQHRGKTVADQLLMSVVMWARDSGARTLIAPVTQSNKRAIRFYARSGFEAYSDQSQSPLTPGLDQIVMGLDLSSLD